VGLSTEERLRPMNKYLSFVSFVGNIVFVEGLRRPRVFILVF